MYISIKIYLHTGETSNCGDNGFQSMGRCYRKYDTPRVSWFDARNSCKGEGGDLASFDLLTKDTLSTLNRSGFNLSTSTDYWVGLKRLKWKWIDTGIFYDLMKWTINISNSKRNMMKILKILCFINYMIFLIEIWPETNKLIYRKFRLCDILTKFNCVIMIILPITNSWVPTAW